MLLGVRPFLHWPQGAPFPPCRRARQPDRSSRRKKPKFARWPTMFKSRWSKSKSEAWVTAWGGRLRPQEQDKISTWNRGREGSQNRASEKGQPPRQWVWVAAWEPVMADGPQMVSAIFPVPQVLTDSGVRAGRWWQEWKGFAAVWDKGKSPSSLGERQCSAACVSSSQGSAWCVEVLKTRSQGCLLVPYSSSARELPWTPERPCANLVLISRSLGRLSWRTGDGADD